MEDKDGAELVPDAIHWDGSVLVLVPLVHLAAEHSINAGCSSAVRAVYEHCIARIPRPAHGSPRVNVYLVGITNGMTIKWNFTGPSDSTGNLTRLH